MVEWCVKICQSIREIFLKRVQELQRQIIKMPPQNGIVDYGVRCVEWS